MAREPTPTLGDVFGEPETRRTLGGTVTSRLRDLIAMILEPSGYVLLRSGHAEEALARSAGHPGPIHLLLTDVVMPGMSGRALADRLTVERPEIRILYMSGHAEDALVHHGQRGPNTGFIGKPFTIDDLRHKVREVLDSKPGAPFSPG